MDASLVTDGKQKRARARRCPACDKCFSGEVRFCPYDGDALIDAPDWNPNADPLIGQIIDSRYEVVSVLGEGGTGSVYEVRHTTLGRRFALKVLRADIARDAQIVTRFIQEAKAAAAIGHPNIVAVSDFGEVVPDKSAPLSSKVPYFVMELLTGSSLASVLRSERILPADRTAAIGLQCALGLASAHEAGVIHRDLKPDNVFLVRSGDREFVKLLDFGLAKIAGTSRVTRQGIIFGTPHYMSPEQAMGQPVDHRTDIYALGVIMYECLTGRVPFEADSFKGVLDQHIHGAAVPVEQRVPDPSQIGPLGEIINRCLAKNPAERFATMAELAAALEEAMGLIPQSGDLMFGEEGQAIGPPRAEKREAPAASAARGPLVVVLAAATVIALGVVAYLAIQPPLTPQTTGATATAPTTPTAPTATVPATPTTPAAVATPAPTPTVTTPPAVTTEEPTPPTPTAQVPPTPTGAQTAVVRPFGTTTGGTWKSTGSPPTATAPATTPTPPPTTTTKKKSGGGGDVVDPWG
ncbi:serine/threonine-protein kinase [Polyangium jinanense]|uniref:Serine/threonine protein kinase n=1 Tax=Polyangium jinanense TaxID=2829994 RepID=A0A9X3X3E6_9BACT|nr:serine/threonine-protein kinase [Polyangium jinanense]MDC3957964.1 serine/threonine protein kinase [Polyangium jinanense]MDC3983517.1 serine/threonine protein kinase [Polyangium jinanense]